MNGIKVLKKAVICMNSFSFMPSKVVLDTHVLIWLVQGDKKLSFKKALFSVLRFDAIHIAPESEAGDRPVLRQALR